MKKISILLLVAMLMLFQFGCNATEEPKQIKVSPDYAVATDISEMVKNAETIVIGTFQEYKHSYNAERNPKNEHEESKEAYSETKVYSFNVEKSLKGDVTESSSIQVSIPYTKELTGLRDEQGKELRFRIPSIGHVQPTLGKRYVLFLMKNERTNSYQAPFTPYMIEIQNDNKVVLQKPQEKVQTSFRSSNNQYQISVEGVHLEKDEISGKDLNVLINEVKNELES
mgnify:CR=1 FL=1